MKKKTRIRKAVDAGVRAAAERLQKETLAELRAKMKPLEDFTTWLEALSKHDRTNFEALVSLPTARKLCEQMEAGEYKKWLTFALDFKDNVARQNKKP